MTLLQRLIPQNLLEEKEKFLVEQSYNPQFTYEDPVPADFITKYGLPDSHKLDLAQTILDRTFSQYTPQELKDLEGPPLTKNEVTEKITAFLEMHGLQSRFEIVWSSSFVARTSVTSSKIKLRLPVSFREQSLLGMLYHEIGTHVLRRINYEQQPWHKKKKTYGFKDYLNTEEGLAVLHSLIPQKLKLAYNPALRYVAVDVAQKKSFVELWEFLKKYTQDPERRWTIAYRLKRGLEDTSQPGGFTKDLTYFEGLVAVWRYLKSQEFNPTQLYYGKMSYVDVAKAVRMNPDFQPVLPSFYIVDPDLYKKQLTQIGKVNLLN